VRVQYLVFRVKFAGYASIYPCFCGLGATFAVPTLPRAASTNIARYAIFIQGVSQERTLSQLSYSSFANTDVSESLLDNALSQDSLAAENANGLARLK
jgi:hypothetical protein